MTASPRALILVVEVDPHVRDLERYFLEGAGFEVLFAQDGAEALDFVGTHQPEVIVTELLVPRRDGLALCRAVRARPDTRHIPILVFSFLEAGDRAREAGADAFLLKPLTDRALISAVERLLEAPEHQ